jgi:hypothetical protein
MMFRIQRGESQSLLASSLNADGVLITVRPKTSCILTPRPILVLLNDALWGITEGKRS